MLKQSIINSAVIFLSRRQYETGVMFHEVDAKFMGTRNSHKRQEKRSVETLILDVIIFLHNQEKDAPSVKELFEIFNEANVKETKARISVAVSLLKKRGLLDMVEHCHYYDYNGGVNTTAVYCLTEYAFIRAVSNVRKVQKNIKKGIDIDNSVRKYDYYSWRDFNNYIATEKIILKYAKKFSPWLFGGWTAENFKAA